MDTNNVDVPAPGPGWRRLQARSRTLRALLKDTHRALRDAADVTQLDPSISNIIQELTAASSRCQALVLLGRTAHARARLLHAILGGQLLPDPMPRGARWIRIQFGSSTSVQLTLGGSEFELVGELASSRQPWKTLPPEDLLRRDETDLSTIVEVELNNPVLKDGLRIIIPPDLDTDPGTAHYRTLKKLHKELYSKRDLILKNYSPVYVFAIDEIGDNIFCDNISAKMPSSKSEEDFWANFNLYNIRNESEGDGVKLEQDSDIAESETWKKGAKETAVISGESCLDLHQIKELSPGAPVLFVLLSTATRPRVAVPAGDLPESDQGLLQGMLSRLKDTAGELTGASRLRDEQVAFMHELMDQWELMFPPPSKHYAKSQWTILDDTEALKNTELVIAKAPLSHTHKDEKRPKVPDKDRISNIKEIEGDRTIKSRAGLVNRVMKFMTEALQSYLLENCTRLSEVHVKIVQHLILTSFSLARELQVVPKRIQYVATQEQQLYKQIVEKFSSGDKKQELVQLMEVVLEEMKVDVDIMDWSVDDLPCHKDRNFLVSNSIFYSTRSSQLSDPTNTLSDRTNTLSDPSTLLSDRTNTLSDEQTSDVEEAESYDAYNFDDYEIIHMNDESLSVSEFYNNRVMPVSPAPSIPVQLGSTLASMDTASICTNATTMSVKEAGLDVQKTVLAQLSRKINLKLDKFVDCLNDTYFGTLERCLEALERACRSELPGAAPPAPASALCRAVRVAATRVSLAPLTSVAWRHALLHAVGRILYRLHLPRGAAWCCPLAAAWRRSAAGVVLRALPAPRLAALVAAQIIERVRAVHARFQSSLSALEAALATRLLHTEDVKLAIRKKHAPGFARLCLESTSMCDLLKYGVPELGREIGRGQYGVVYAVRGSWAGCSRVAVKSVLPADERHCNELAMEFFYARSLPPHPRVLRLLGSLCRGNAVLLAAPRRQRDLHAAVRAGLSLPSALCIASDVIAGIRYLHSLGLVHRDIKMKNVLLDHNNRAALSDLGFLCSAGLVCGSLVGTPVHMAPELLAGNYDHSVDVYAFGIMFWYLCAGSVKLPAAFEAFQNKEQLWSKVKRGLRPERLPQFRLDCWDIMESCWASEPSQRAHLGDIQTKLEKIIQEVTQGGAIDTPVAGSEDLSSLTDEDSINEERDY